MQGWENVVSSNRHRKELVAGMNMECEQRGETEQWLGIGGVMNVVAREQLGTRRNKS